jgi:hypothetical protein
MSENASLTPEEKDLLRAVVRKRQPSMQWSVAAAGEKPLTPAQRDIIKGHLMDELREAGGPTTDRGAAIKKLIDRLGSL